MQTVRELLAEHRRRPRCSERGSRYQRKRHRRGGYSSQTQVNINNQ
jgi:hypothetical protein